MTTAVEPHPIESLREDHRRAIRLIRMLVDRVGGLVRPDPADLQIAQDVMRYMVEFVDHRHHDREDLIIAALGERDGKLKRRAAQSAKAHDTLRAEGQSLLAMIAQLRERRSAWMSSLIRRLRHYLNELEAHFAFEEAELFRPARDMLSDREWRRIGKAHKAGADPLFGDEVEEEFRELFDIYVSQVREIGTPAVQSASAAAAAVVDGSLAALEGARSALSTVRAGAARTWQAHLEGALATAGSTSWFEAFGNAQRWYWNVFDEALGNTRAFGDAMSDAAWSALEPVGEALGAQSREFQNSHRAENTSPSWQVRLMNLGLRATIKRMAGSADLEAIRTPRSSFDLFVPRLASDVRVEAVDLGSATAEIISIEGATEDRTVLHCPGGGFVMAATQAHRLLAQRLARRLNARVMLVHYRLAPEHMFPAGLDDCCAAYRWLLDQGTEPQSIVVSGDSAGGGLALSTVLRARNEGRETPGAVVLLSPVTDLTYSGASRRDNRWVDPSLPNDDGNVIADLYLGDVPQDDPRASPLFADLSNLPPTLIQVGSIEVLLDDSLRVAAKIRAQGGDCECEVWHDMPHDWMLFGMLPESRRALRRMVTFIDRVTERVPALAG